MTKIYTANTIVANTPLSQIDITEDSYVKLTATVDAYWINFTNNQRFLFYKWQESNDNGQTWSDIPAGVSEQSLSKNETIENKRYVTSSIENQNLDIKLVEFNLGDSVVPRCYLEFDKVYLEQNNYRYRCTVILYNNDTNTIESATSTDPIILTISANNLDKEILEVDIPWDPMNPLGVIKSGNLKLNSDSAIVLWDPNYNPAPGTQWRIIDVGLNVSLMEGSISNGSLAGIPSSFGPADKKEPRFMQLQNYNNGVWNVLESWTSKIGDNLHIFDHYGGPTSSKTTVAMNGVPFIENISLGSKSNPTIIKLGLDNNGNISLDYDRTDTISSCISVSWNGNEGTNYNTIGIIPDSIQTITVPDTLKFPVQVTITGGADDDLVVNGQVINQNNSADPVNYTFTTNSSTFTVGVHNGACCGAAYGYTICFTGQPNASITSDITKSNTTNILTFTNNTLVKEVSTLGAEAAALTYALTVDPRADWQDSGITVNAGDRISMSATGTVGWGQGSSGPDGIYHPYAMLDSRFLHEAILGKIGINGSIFLVGSNFNGAAEATGRLYFITNDVAKGDNSGSFQLTVNVFQQFISCPNLGFLAFDGSGRRFLYATWRDDDVCFMNGNNGGQWATDGGYTIKALCDGTAVITFSDNWFAAYGGFDVGKIVQLPDMRSGLRYVSPTQSLWNIGHGCPPVGPNSGWTLSGEISNSTGVISNAINVIVKQDISVTNDPTLVDTNHSNISLLASFSDESVTSS